MKAAIYNPYLDTLGGGERYTMAIALCLSQMGYEVDVSWKDLLIKQKLESRFGINLNNINFISNINRGEEYDLCFWVSDGSIPTLRSRKNMIHFQVPFKDVNGKSLMNKMKMFRINKIICNSIFTKNVIDKEFGVDSVVLYPPVNTKDIKVKRKEKIILFVGRFSQLKQSKNQHILIKHFKRFYDSGQKDWKLILVGGVEVGSNDYLEELEKIIGDYPIEIIKSPDFKALIDLYGRAKIFWSAVGYGENENKNPEKVEHFGITVVEAMAAGVIPFVFNAGGYKEIISNNNGFLWNEPKEMVAMTKKLCNEPYSVWKSLIENGRLDSKKYSYDSFNENFIKILNK